MGLIDSTGQTAKSAHDAAFGPSESSRCMKQHKKLGQYFDPVIAQEAELSGPSITTGMPPVREPSRLSNAPPSGVGLQRIPEAEPSGL